MENENPHTSAASEAPGDSMMEAGSQSTPSQDTGGDTGDLTLEAEVDETRGVDSESLDDGELPSLEGLDQPIVSAETPISGDTSVKSTIDLLGAAEDPEVVARAVRTFMTKDK